MNEELLGNWSGGICFRKRKSYSAWSGGKVADWQESGVRSQEPPMSLVVPIMD